MGENERRKGHADATGRKDVNVEGVGKAPSVICSAPLARPLRTVQTATEAAEAVGSCQIRGRPAI
jgi:hypothetical protein